MATTTFTPNEPNPPDSRPRCRVCEHPLTDPRSVALLLGPCCQDRVQPADLRKLAAAASKAVVGLTVQTVMTDAHEWGQAA